MATISEQELRRKRAIVGLLALTGLIGGTGLLISGKSDGLASALLRIGLLLGAFWLALPAKDRPAAWARVSPWSLAVIVLTALALPRLRFFVPVLAAALAIGWLVRPRPRNGRGQSP